MSTINLLLNLAALLLWFKWRALRTQDRNAPKPSTLAGTLRRAEPPRLRSWHLLACLPVLLLIRALLYWQIGPAVDWVPNLKLAAISVPFRSDFFWLMLSFSTLSFLATLGVFYLWLLLLSVTNGSTADSNAWQTLVRAYLGRISGWPAGVRLALPLLVGATCWLALDPLLIRLHLLQPPISAAHRLEQAALIGLGTYLNWQYLIGVALLLFLVNNYIYLGNHSFWKFVALTGRNLLQPLRWLRLRIGKADFAPLVGIAIIFFAAQAAERGLTELYRRLPL